MPANTSQDTVVPHIAIKINGALLDDTYLDLLTYAEVDTSLHMPTMFVLQFHDDELKLVDDPKFKIGAAIEVEMPNTTNQLTSIAKGEITSLEPEFSDHNTVTFTVRGYDKLHRLGRGTITMTYQNVTDSDIMSTIAKRNGLQTQITTTSIKHDHVFQHNLSDLEFLHMLARRSGLEVYVDDSKLVVQPVSTPRGSATLKWGQSLRSFRPRLTLSEQVQEVQVKAWDSVQKKVILGKATTSRATPSVGIRGTAVGLSKEFGNAKTIEVYSPVTTQEAAQKQAQALLDTIHANFLEAEGAAFGDATLVAGCSVTIDGVGRQFSGTYKLSSAVHRYSTQTGYDTHFTVEGAQRHLVADLVTQASSPTLPGLVIGVVTNSKDPKNMARVRVKLPWLSETDESTWARVVMLGGGNNRGLFWLPQVNDEVLVGFEHGDINFPFVIGGLYNSKDAAPLSAADSVKGGVIQRMLKTDRISILLKEDAASEMIEIRDMDNKAVLRMTTKPQPKIEILCANGDVMVKAMNATIDATQKVDVKGLNVNVEAKTQLMLKGATVNLEGSGPVVIKGAIVNIN
ncbi:MAG: VgrG-related protein [bacterium]|nr:VgrG-related protein [bacterium]